MTDRELGLLGGPAAASRVPPQGTRNAATQEQEAVAPTSIVEAQALQSRFGNHAVQQMVEIATGSQGDEMARAIEPDGAPRSAEMAEAETAGPAPELAQLTDVEPVSKPAQDAEREMHPRATRDEPPPGPEIEEDSAKETATEPIAAPEPAPRAAEKAVEETSDKTRAPVLGMFLAALAARPGAAPWAVLVSAYADAPRKAAQEAATAIAAVIMLVSEHGRKRIDMRLGRLERSPAAPEIIQLIRAHLAAAPGPVPPPAPPPVED